MAKLTFLHSLKKRFAASPGKREDQPSKPPAELSENQVAAVRDAYTTVILEASEKGIETAARRDEVIQATAKIASDWTGTTISEDGVRKVIGS